MRRLDLIALSASVLMVLAFTVAPVSGATQLPRHELVQTAVEDHSVHQLPPPGNPPKPKPSSPGRNGSTLTQATTLSADAAPAVVQLSTTHDKSLSAPTFKMQCLADPHVHYLIVDYNGPTVSSSNQNIQRWFTHDYCAADGTLTWTSEIVGAFDNSVVTCRSWFVVTHTTEAGWGTWSSGLSYKNGAVNDGSCPVAGL